MIRVDTCSFCYIRTYAFSLTFSYIFYNILSRLIRHAFNKDTLKFIEQ